MPSASTEPGLQRGTRSRLLTWIAPALAAVVLALKLISTGSGPLTNPDTYFHLRFGSEFATNWHAWSPGQLDRYATADWVPTQWLSQLGMYDVERWFGLPGIAVLSTATLVALLASWYVTARRRADPLPAVLLTALALIASSGSLSARPQVASLVLATWTASTWRRSADTGRIPWWLIPIGWLWAMVHGMWILGALVSLVLAAALVVERKLPARALVVGVASLAVAAITPAGPALLEAVLRVNSRSGYIPEWATPDFTSVTGAVAIGLLGLTVLLLQRAGDASWYELATVGTSSVFTLYSDRTLPVGTCILLPVLAARLQSTIGLRIAVIRRERAVAGCMCAAVVLAVAVIAPQRAAAPPAYTHAFDGQLAALAPGTPLLTDWPDGGPMLWTHPELDIPFHGYFDVYTDHELATYVAMFALEPGWDRTLRGLGIQQALLPAASPLAYALAARGWVVEGAASGRELLRAPAHWSSS